MRAIRLLGAALMVIACGTGSESVGVPPPGGGGGGGGGGGTTCVGTTTAISITDSAFNPVCTRVPVNSTVRWTNNGALEHNVTFNDAGVGNSGRIGPSGTFQKTFGTAGIYGYNCTLHPGMNGSVEIQ